MLKKKNGNIVLELPKRSLYKNALYVFNYMLNNEFFKRNYAVFKI